MNPQIPESMLPEKSGISHTQMKKVIWKGKMAPKGSLYYVVKMKIDKKTITSVYVVKNGKTEEEQKIVFLQMLEEIHQKVKSK